MWKSSEGFAFVVVFPIHLFDVRWPEQQTNRFFIFRSFNEHRFEYRFCCRLKWLTETGTNRTNEALRGQGKYRILSDIYRISRSLKFFFYRNSKYSSIHYYQFQANKFNRIRSFDYLLNSEKKMEKMNIWIILRLRLNALVSVFRQPDQISSPSPSLRCHRRQRQNRQLEKSTKRVFYQCV